MALQNGARCCNGGLCSHVLSPQFFEQGFGLLQVGSVKALGKPAIDRCQQVVGFLALALLLPQGQPVS